MSILNKTSKVLFVVATALIFVALIAKIYRIGENRRFLAPESNSSLARKEPNSNSSLPVSQVPADKKELVKLPGGDVGYASDAADYFEDAILKDEVHDFTVAEEDLPPTTSDAETALTQSTPDSNSLPLVFESNDVQTSEPSSDEKPVVSTPEKFSPETDETPSVAILASNNDVGSPLEDSLSSIDQTSQDAESRDPSTELNNLSSSSSTPFPNKSATEADSVANVLKPKASGDDSSEAVSNDLELASNPIDEKTLAAQSVSEPIKNDSNSDVVSVQESDVTTSAESSSDELAANDLPKPDDQSDDILPPNGTEVSTNSEPSAVKLAVNDLLKPDDQSDDILPPNGSEVSTNSEPSAVELAANDLPKPDDQSDDILPPNGSEVSTSFEPSAVELAANDLPKPDDQSTDILPTNGSEVSTSFEPSAVELAANDLPKPDDQSTDILPPNGTEVSTSFEPSAVELAANDLPKPDDQSADILPPNGSEVSTSFEPSADELAANDLPEFDDLTANISTQDKSDVSTDSEPSSNEFATNDLPEYDNQTVAILQPDDSDVSTNSEPSPDELAANDLSRADDSIDVTNSAPSFGELSGDNLSQANVTDVLKKSDPTSADFGANEAPKSDGWTSWHSDSAIETLPDGLGTISSKSSSDESSSTLQDDALVANQTPQPNDARSSASVKPNNPTFDLSSFELRKNESTNYYLERWNTLDKAWQEYLAPLSDEERLTVIEHNQSQMDQICLVIAKRLAFADDLSVNKRDGFFRLYASLLANARKTSELTSLLMEERANKSNADARLGFLEVLIFEARVQSVGDMKDSDGLLNLSKELIQAASTSNVKYFLRKTKYLANLIGQYDKNLGERTFSVICQEFANSQDKFRRNMPSVFAGEARFESLPGNEMLLGGMSVDRRDVDLLNYRGKTTLVIFTNSSCAPYLDELPSLRDVYAQYHRAGFEIVEYNLDVDVDALRKFIRAQNIPWTVVSQKLTAQIDGKDFVNPCVYYGIANLPTAILLDKNGKVISTFARRGRLTEELAEIYPNVR